MPTQLQLEGPDLETLLGRVKAEHGPGARIVRAEKVRSGGVAGFFAKERFEICVELDGPAGALPTGPAPLLDVTGAPLTAPRASAPRPSSPMSVLDLADQVSADELSSQSRRSSDRPAAPRRSTDRPLGAPVPASAATASPAEPLVSTETSSFASILARLGVDAGPGFAPLETPPPVTTAPSGAAPERPTAPAPSAPVTDLQGLPALPRQRAASEPGTDLTVRRAAEVAVRGVERAPAPLTGVSGELVSLGLPEHLLPALGSGPVYPSLVQSLRRLPKVPRATNRAGGVLVVVGPQSLALEVAREIARDLKLPVATAVVLATTRRGRTELPAKQVLRTATAAVERRALWRRRRNLTIVAVDAPLTAAGAAAARTFLTALQPSATWGVVEATRKAHDVGRWTRALGGVDALALTAVEETADPAAVLTLGIPVGRLGAAKATPAAWAALLTERMAA